MIKGITFQGEVDFKSYLYALEIASRFIDQSKANGYYRSCGTELEASASSKTITLGSGAFLVQGRMCVVEDSESITIEQSAAGVGYLIARIDTFNYSQNCSLIYKIADKLSNISLVQHNVNTLESETVNKVYELPIYSFRYDGSKVTNLVKLIEPICDYAKVNEISKEAIQRAKSAEVNSTDATSVANSARAFSEEAKRMANDALNRIVEGAGGTAILQNGVKLGVLSIDDIVKMTAVAALAFEAEQASGYTLGGSIDTKFKQLEKRISTLEAGK